VAGATFGAAMAFDRSRPIPWKQIFITAGVTVVLMNLVFFVFARDDYGADTVLTSVFAGGFYVAMMVLLTKFGYSVTGANRRPRPTPAAKGNGGTAPAAGVKARPAATSRTNAANRRTPPKRRPPSKQR
jgi:hypothetical protein